MVHRIDELANGDAAQRALILPATTRRTGMRGNGVSITPDVTYDRCPTGLDVIFVPGGGDGTVRIRQQVAVRYSCTATCCSRRHPIHHSSAVGNNSASRVPPCPASTSPTDRSS